MRTSVFLVRISACAHTHTHTHTRTYTYIPKRFGLWNISGPFIFDRARPRAIFLDKFTRKFLIGDVVIVPLYFSHFKRGTLLLSGLLLSRRSCNRESLQQIGLYYYIKEGRGCFWSGRKYLHAHESIRHALLISGVILNALPKLHGPVELSSLATGDSVIAARQFISAEISTYVFRGNEVACGCNSRNV